MPTAPLPPCKNFDVLPHLHSYSMTRQLRLIEIPTIHDQASGSRRLTSQTRNLGRKGVAAARAALAAAQHLPDIDLDAA